MILITNLFSAIVTVGHILTIWKKGLVIPVHKGGSKPSHKGGSKRHINVNRTDLFHFYVLFTNFLRRLFSRIHYWIETFSVIFPNKQQQGFTKSLNCITATFTLSEAILSAFELYSTGIFAAFLDIMRAFDTVWHAGLINKLKTLGIKGPLLRIINQCYTDIKSAVFVNGVTSTINFSIFNSNFVLYN